VTVRFNGEKAAISGSIEATAILGKREEKDNQ